MRRLPHPMPGSKETRFDFRSYPSLAPDLVAGLQNLPERTANSRGESSGTRVRARPAREVNVMGHAATELQSKRLVPRIVFRSGCPPFRRTETGTEQQKKIHNGGINA